MEMTDRLRRMQRVWDLSVEEAQQTLRAVKLSFAIHHAQSPVVPEGALIGASPPPGSHLNDDMVVVLTASTGPPRTDPGKGCP